jgi:hypothetical protein
VTQEIGSKSVEFYSVSCTVHKNLCRHFEIKGYPRIHLFREGSSQSVEVNYFELHPFGVLNSLGVQVDSMRLDVDLKRLSPKQKKQEKKLLQHSGQRTKKQVFDDAYLSFDFNIRNGIFTSNDPMVNSTKAALHDWLVLLQRSLPPAWQLQKAINALLDNFEVATSGEDQLLSILNQAPPPPTKKWSSACTKGMPGMGYTCGLWELFHIVTVGVVEWNLMLGSGQIDIAISTVEAANILRNFIANFFGCEVCRMHFLSAFDACEIDRCHRLNEDDASYEAWLQFPVWLFETHNAVNVRLMKEHTEREYTAATHSTDEMYGQWPHREECPKCWRSDGSWDEENIYKFLRIEYWYVAQMH